ncbi:unnamed protein product [Closterium sp. Naga37s-1]|nr:unnamed protein product [Closterium sp. Naga37s-1]
MRQLNEEPPGQQVATSPAGRSRGAEGGSATRTPPGKAVREDREWQEEDVTAAEAAVETEAALAEPAVVAAAEAPVGGAETRAAEAATSATAAAGIEAEPELAAELAAASGADSASHREAGPAAVPHSEVEGLAVEQERATEAVVLAPRAPTAALSAAKREWTWAQPREM